MANLSIGHLTTDKESKISTTPVTDGRVIFSEKNGLQFVDYNSKRHTLGNVLHGIYNGTAFLDFSTSTISEILTALKNSTVPDGQMITTGSMYQYRIIKNYRILAMPNRNGIDVAASSRGYLINIPKRTTSDTITIDAIVSINNTTNGNKTFFLKIANDGTITAASSGDVDGDFNASTCNVTVTREGTLYWIGASVKSYLKIVSFSVSINGTITNDVEGFYVAGISAIV